MTTLKLALPVPLVFAITACAGGEEAPQDEAVSGTVDSGAVAGGEDRMMAPDSPAPQLPEGEDTIWLTIGELSVPLGNDQRFSDIAADALPEPVSVPPQGRHDATALCYRVPGGHLRLYDSDWGMHTLRIVRAAEEGSLSCPRLADTPFVVVAGERLNLQTAPAELERLRARGFKLGHSSQGTEYERGWSYFDEEWDACIGATQSVIVRLDETGAIQWMQVQDFEERDAESACSG